MNFLRTFVMIFLASIPIAEIAEARRGCCSHHGGVCSNSCCDGTALSIKCGGGKVDHSAEPAKVKTKKKIKEPASEEKEEQPTSEIRDAG